MRKYINDFRIFTGKTALITAMWSELAVIVLFAALIAVHTLTDSETIRGFCEGFIPMFCTLIPIIGYIPCNTTFNLNRAVNPGYKYFHSLPDSAGRFRRALTASSVISLALVLIWAGALWLWSPTISMFIVFMGLSLKGTQNIFGHAKSGLGMFLPMLVVISAMGFLMGFTSTDADSLIYMKPEGIFYAAPAAGAAIFVVGTVYSAAVAEKKWRREVD